MPKWTFPDLEGYTRQSVVLRIRTALLKVCEEMQEEFSSSQKQYLWRPFPLWSAINLNAIGLVMPSASTLLTLEHSSNDVGGARSEVAPQTSDSCRSVAHQSTIVVCTTGNLSLSVSHQVVFHNKQGSNANVPIIVI